MKFCVLGSGSKGNSIAVWEEESGILIDAGLSFKQMIERLVRVGADPAWFHDVIVTHAHGDHTKSLRMWHKQEAAIWATKETATQLDPPAIVEHLIEPRTAFTCGPCLVLPLASDHACLGAVCFFVASKADHILAVLTETGTISPEMWQYASQSQALILEANHDKEMLAMNESRPEFVNTAAAHRHLNNLQAAAVLSQLTNWTRTAVLVHLSQECNDPQLVWNICRPVCPKHIRLEISHQDKPTEVFDV